MAAILRVARGEDAAAFAHIYAPYVANTTVSFETQPPDAAEMARRVETIQAMYPWIVWEEDGRVLGYAYAHEYGERAGFNWSAISSVYVAGDAQGRGIGHRLYDALEELLAAQGVRSLYAWVTSPNPASDRFHLARGYEKQGYFPEIGYKFGRCVGVTHYCRRLLPVCENPPPVTPFPALNGVAVGRILARERMQGCQ